MVEGVSISLKGKRGRLLRGSTPLTVLGPWHATNAGAGWRVTVESHTPHPVFWRLRNGGEVTAELELGKSRHQLRGLITSEEPLTLELEANGTHAT